MNLQEPTKKRSKSDDNEKATIYLTDTNPEIINKIKRSVTDSDSEVRFSDEKPTCRISTPGLRGSAPARTWPMGRRTSVVDLRDEQR